MVREPGMCLSQDQYYPPGWIVAIISSVKVVSSMTRQACCEGNYRTCFHNLPFITDGYSYFKNIIMLPSESWAVSSCPVLEARVSNNKDIKINWRFSYPIWSGTYTLFVTWGDRDLLNSPYPVIIRDGSDMGDAAAAAGGMNAHQNYNLSSYREQHSSSNTSQQQQKGMCKPHGATSCQQSLAYVDPSSIRVCSRVSHNASSDNAKAYSWEFRFKTAMQKCCSYALFVESREICQLC